MHNQNKPITKAVKATQKSGKKLAHLYWRQAENDLRRADRLKFKKVDESSLLSVQSALNRLNAVVVAYDLFQRPSFRLAEMLITLKKLDKRFEELSNLAVDLDMVGDLVDLTKLDSTKKLKKKDAERFVGISREFKTKLVQLLVANRLYCPPTLSFWWQSIWHRKNLPSPMGKS